MGTAGAAGHSFVTTIRREHRSTESIVPESVICVCSEQRQVQVVRRGLRCATKRVAQRLGLCLNKDSIGQQRPHEQRPSSHLLERATSRIRERDDICGAAIFVHSVVPSGCAAGGDHG